MPDSRSGDPGSKASFRKKRKVPAGAPHSTKIGEIIIVTGTPGVGKSAIAPGLAKTLGYQHLDISRFVKQLELYSKPDSQRKTLVTDFRKLRVSLNKVLGTPRRGTRGFVISTHYLDRFIPARKVKVIFVLRLHPALLYKRLVQRRWQAQKIAENIESELIGVCLVEALDFVGKKRVYEIDTSNRSVLGIRKEMLKLLRSSNTGRVAIVDWLESYDPGLVRKLE